MSLSNVSSLKGVPLTNYFKKNRYGDRPRIPLSRLPYRQTQMPSKDKKSGAKTRVTLLFLPTREIPLNWNNPPPHPTLPHLRHQELPEILLEFLCLARKEWERKWDESGTSPPQPILGALSLQRPAFEIQGPFHTEVLCLSYDKGSPWKPTQAKQWINGWDYFCNKRNRSVFKFVRNITDNSPSILSSHVSNVLQADLSPQWLTCAHACPWPPKSPIGCEHQKARHQAKETSGRERVRTDRTRACFGKVFSWGLMGSPFRSRIHWVKLLCQETSAGN